MHWAPLTEAEQSYLIRILSDQESGHARQWYWLEIAQTLPTPDKTRRAYLIGIAIKHFGNKLCSPILLKLKVKGIGLYQASAVKHSDYAKQKINDALLFSGSLLAILTGFQLLPASLQFAAWCLGIAGAAWHIVRVWRQTPPATRDNIEQEDEDLLGAEASLGLTSILMAAGISSQLSLSLVKGLKQNPQGLIEPLLINVPKLQPDIEPSSRVKLLIAGLPWLALGMINSWIVGLLPHYWGVAMAMLSLGGIAALLHRQKQATFVLLATWIGCFALASAAHYI